ncbi:MAG TPA: inositol monophosphatase family protein [Candidatus Methylomirabilis sp.]|nr:inositol monophosphatase family protein [Candidatus Methylomirabilis sp.]
MANNKKQWLKAAWSAARAGERVLLRYFNVNHTQTYGFKKYHEIVTEADKRSNDAIIKVLKRLSPDIPVLSEEGGTIDERAVQHADLAWVLDPLDGTTNYAARLPLWGISLALVKRGQPVLGVISLPVLKHRYHAVKGGGAWMGRMRLHVSKTRNLADSIGLMCFGYDGGSYRRYRRIEPTLTKNSRSTRKLGAAVVESIWVASGRADYAILNGVHDWDVAAGTLLVTEAGGRAVTTKGKPWAMGEPDIVMCTPGIASAVLRVTRP